MKRILAIITLISMLLTSFSINVSADENTVVYFDEQLSAAVTAKYVSGDVYLCFEELFEKYGYEIERSSSSYSYGLEFIYVEFDIDDDDYTESIARFLYDSDDNSGEFKVFEDGYEYLKVKSKEREWECEFSKPVVKVDNDHHYVYYKDIERFLKLSVAPAAELNMVGLYRKKTMPQNVTLYNKKGEALKVCKYFKDKYVEAGYKENLEDVLIIPDSEIIQSDGIKVSLNGGLLKFDVMPTEINGRTMVPLRAIFEALSATVEWDSDTQTVVSKKDGITVELTVDSDKMKVNNKTITLDCPATEIDGRTLVPVRAVSEAFGLTVDWNESASVVVLREEKYADVETVLLYDLSNQIIEVPDFEVEDFKAIGWIEEKPVKMYAADGRTQYVPSKDVDANKSVGWFTSPVVTMYALDGRTQAVGSADVEAFKAVGWYENPVEAVTLYAPDGRSQNVLKQDAEAYKAVGWYDYPVTTMYAADGRTIVISSGEVARYSANGWYTASQYNLVKYAYLAGSDFRSIRSRYSTAKANGAYMYPYTDQNGDYCILVYVSYKIISNYHAYFLHNISKGTRIEEPTDYYDRLINQAWGASKINYMGLKGDVLGAQINALKGFIGEINTGLFINAATLNL